MSGLPEQRTALLAGGARGIDTSTACRLGRDVTEHQRPAARAIPIGRGGQPQDIAHAVPFPAGPQARFVSEQVRRVAGGPVE